MRIGPVHVTLSAVRILALIVLAGVPALMAPAQTNTNSLDQLFQAAEQFARENFDDSVLQLFDPVDRDRVEQFLRDVQQRFDSDYVIDIDELQDAARAVLPLLEAHEETQPYAAWLKSRLDYFVVVEKLKRSVAPPQPKPGEPPGPIPPPGPELERKVWKTQFEKSPWPKAAGEFVPQLKPVFAKQGVAPELVWIAEVESSFDPRARSPAGAVGLFQLTPDTAKRMGLSLWPWDERKRAEPSARATAQYLRHLYGQFHDWRLALAAYNAGEGRVRALLARHKTKSFDAIATKLPAETQLFVPKVEATLLRREGVTLSNLKPAKG